MGLGGCVQVCQHRAAAYPDSACRRVDLDRVEAAEMDHHPARAHRGAPGVVTTPAYRYLQAVAPGEVDRRCDVGRQMLLGPERLIYESA
jgi:hypothetical protein